MNDNLKAFLDEKVSQYNRPEFITNDPVSIPHLFTKKQDIEIMGFWAATLAWGQRVTIINKCKELIGLMDGAPYDFIINHQEPDLKKLLHFKHRTFNDIDTLYFISFFRHHYELFESLEDAFVPIGSALEVEESLNHFRSYFTSLPDFPNRTKKHVSSPSQKSTCKRLCMFLRWMVRKDANGVDFGIWNKLKSADLICPCDLHVDRVARKLKLITRKQTDWQTAVELTRNLRELDPNDPVKYDFALFGLGIEERWGIEVYCPTFDIFTDMTPGEEQSISAFLTGKSDHTLALFHYFIAKFSEIGDISIEPTKTMIGISNAHKRIAWVTQMGRNFVHVVFPFKQEYADNLCFQKVGWVPGQNQCNHHFRMLMIDDLNDEVLRFMRLAYKCETGEG